VIPEEAARDPDWNEIVERVRMGDEAAATRLVEGLYGHVLRIVRNHLPRQADEQDLAQEVFMKAFAAIDGFRGAQPFPHWLARIAVNTCRDQLRRQKARPELRFSDLGEPDVAFLESVMADGTDRADPPPEAGGRELVEKLLATLKPGERLLLQWLDLEKKTVREVCDLTGWGISKVKVGAMRARRKLNENLKRLEAKWKP
jgi:RNA polymerase sigma factor (sigma-70 family)